MQPVSQIEPMHIEHCYSVDLRQPSHRSPPLGVRLRLLVVDPARKTRWVIGSVGVAGRWTSAEAGSLWRVIGWRPTDGSFPFGDLDVVDAHIVALAALPFAFTPAETAGSDPRPPRRIYPAPI